MFERHGAVRYTTHATLAIEQEVIDIVTVGRGAGRGVADADAVHRSIARAGLGEDQAAAVRAVTLDGHVVACVVGPAGTGKSRTMGAAAAAWQASGVPVRGLAVSAVAAGVLRAEAGVPADTVAKLLFEHDRRGAASDGWRLRRGEVVVVDLCRHRDYAHSGSGGYARRRCGWASRLSGALGGRHNHRLSRKASSGSGGR
ncbi:MAG: AAA family ATPase [Acidimicrobiales bacterium]